VFSRVSLHGLNHAFTRTLLWLNTNKTELLWCATARRQSQLPYTPLRVGPHLVNPMSPACTSIPTYRSHSDTKSYCVVLCYYATAADSTSATYKTLIVSLVLSRLDYGNATLYGLPEYQFRRLQSVINVAARSIYYQRWSDNVTPTLLELHWLSAVDRVNFKVVTLVYRCLHDLAPPYLSRLHRLLSLNSARAMHIC